MMLEPLLIVELAALGLCTGFLAGLLGIGGGMIMVPFITVILSGRGVAPDLAVKMAIATSMATIIFTSVSSVRAHHKRGAVRWDIVKLLAPGIVIGAALASLGVFAESGSQPRHFVLTPLAELLRSDHPSSLRQFTRMLGGEHYDAWTDLLHSVRSGERAFRHHFGEPVFHWYGHNPVRGAIFDGAMTDFSRVETEGLLATWDFSASRHLIDVGGDFGAAFGAARLGMMAATGPNVSSR